MPSLGTIFVSIILIAIFAFAIRHMVASKKSGGSCGCGCSGCASKQHGTSANETSCCSRQH